MLTQYKNIDQIRNSTSAILAERYPSINKNLFKSTGYTFDPSITTSGAGSQIELHVYASDNWLTGNHSVNAILPCKCNSYLEIHSSLEIHFFPENTILPCSAWPGG